MTKKCIVCENEGEYTIKGSSEIYCTDCAEEQFADLSYLVKVGEQAKKITQSVE